MSYYPGQQYHGNNYGPPPPQQYGAPSPQGYPPPHQNYGAP
jgi:hypothetical protein